MRTTLSHLFSLLVLGLLGLCVLLSCAWPSRYATAQETLAQPIMLRRQRSKEPKPFAGLLHKPPCALRRCHRPTDAREAFANLFKK